MTSSLKLSGIDTFVIVISSILISIGAYFFFLDTTSDVLNKNIEKIGVQLNGVGTQKNNGSLFWKPLIENSSIYSGDKIFANKEDDVNLKLHKSDVTIKIPKNSLVVIHEDNGDLVINLDMGEVELTSSNSISKLKIKDKHGKINSIKIEKNSKLTVKKTQGSTSIDVSKGSVEFFNINDKLAQVVKVNEFVKLEKNTFEKVNFGGIFLNNKISAENTKKIEINKNILSNSIILSDDINMQKVIELPIENSILDISKLHPGVYFAKLSEEKEIDKFEILPYKSFLLEQNLFEILKGEEVVLRWPVLENHNFILDILTPNGKKVTKLTSENYFKFIPINHGVYEIKISPNKEIIETFSKFSIIKVANGASYYRLANEEFQKVQVSLKPSVVINDHEEYIDKSDDKITEIIVANFSKDNIKYVLSRDEKIVKKQMVINNVINLKNLEYGSYDLKIFSDPENVLLASKTIFIKDRIEAFEIKKDDIKNENNTFLVPYRWKYNTEYVGEVELELYKEKGKKLYFSKSLTGLEFDFNMVKGDEIMWRVVSKDSNVFSSRFMTIKFFGMIEKLPFNPKTILKYSEELGGCYQFEIPYIENAKKYTVQIIENLQTRNIISVIDSKEQKICWKSNKSGKYYYRYRYYNKWNQKSKFSQPGEIIFPISPLTEF